MQFCPLDQEFGLSSEVASGDQIYGCVARFISLEVGVYNLHYPQSPHSQLATEQVFVFASPGEFYKLRVGHRKRTDCNPSIIA